MYAKTHLDGVDQGRDAQGQATAEDSEDGEAQVLGDPDRVGIGDKHSLGL